MKAKVFISCGQRPDEKKVGEEIKKILDRLGFDPFYAEEVKNPFEINTKIISELQSSDYFLLINLRRERVVPDEGECFYRGSLYCHQELAMAVAWEMEEQILVFDQKGVKAEGLLGFYANNIKAFETIDELYGLVNSVKDYGWDNSFSRNFFINSLPELSLTPYDYKDNPQTKKARIQRVEIQNKRKNKEAFHAVCRLQKINSKDSGDKNVLKVSGSQQFSQVIWPGEKGEFDLFVIDSNNFEKVYLRSASDVRSFIDNQYVRDPIIKEKGEYILEYGIFAQNFPKKEFKVRLKITGDSKTTKSELLKDTESE